MNAEANTIREDYTLSDIEDKVIELGDLLGGYVGEGNLIDELDWIINEVKGMHRGEETVAAVSRRISKITGFKESEIVPLEGSLENGIYVSVEFAVHGKGFWTDFKDWDRAKAFDLEVGQ